MSLYSGFHSGTLAVMNAITAFSLSLFILLFRTALPRYAGLLLWSFSIASIGAGFAAIGLRRFGVGEYLIILETTGIALGAAFYFHGFESFMGRTKRRSLLIYLVPLGALLAGIHLYLSGLTESAPDVVDSLALGIVFCAVAVSALGDLPQRRPGAASAIAVVFGLMASVNFCRSLFLIFLPTADDPNYQVLQAVAYLASDAGIIAACACFLVVVVLRLLDDLALHVHEQDSLQRERMVRTIIDTIPHFIIFKDAKSRYRLCNAAYSRAMGMDAAQIEGRTDYDLYPPELADKYVADDRSVMENRTTWDSVERHSIEGREHWVEVTKTPFITTEGAADGVIVVFRDISEMQENARLLRESEQRYRELSADLERRVLERTRELTATKRKIDIFFDVTLDYLVFTDLEGRFTKLSPSCMADTGYTEEQLIGHHFFRFIHPEDRIRSMRNAQKLASGNRMLSQACRFRKADGTWVWLSWSAVAVPDRGMAIASAHDVTARVEAENHLREAREEAERMNKAKSQFISTMSHELRTPLNAVLGYAALLSPLTENEKASRYVTSIASSGKALLTIINDLLDLTKAESGRMELAPVPFDLRKLLEEVLEIFRFGAEEKGLHLELKAEKGLPRTVLLDPARLRQVLINLMGNSIKFTEQGRVTVNLSVPPREPNPAESDSSMFTTELSIAVEDTGIGMTEEYRSRLFQPFSQEGVEIARRYGGTGLGLAIAKRILDLMGGSIACASAQGRGTSFAIRIPDVRAAGAVDEFTLSAGPSGFEGTPLGAIVAAEEPRARVLVVDDDPQSNAVAYRVLEAERMAMITADDGDSVLAKAGEADLILLNATAHGMDGYELCRRLRDRPRSAKVPILLLTTKTGREDLVEGVRAGVVDYLSKPLDPGELSARIAVHLNLKRARDNLERRTLEAMDAKREVETKKKEIESLAARLDKESSVDDLTGLLNRRALGVRLNEEFVRARRSGRAMGLLAGGLDGLEDIRRTLGEKGFNAVVAEGARRFSEALREEDVLGRWEEGNFLAVLVDTDQEHALMAAERVRARVGNRPFVFGANLLKASISLGTVSAKPDQAADPEASIAELEATAELARERAREKGGDRVEAGEWKRAEADQLPLEAADSPPDAKRSTRRARANPSR